MYRISLFISILVCFLLISCGGESPFPPEFLIGRPISLSPVFSYRLQSSMYSGDVYSIGYDQPFIRTIQIPTYTYFDSRRDTFFVVRGDESLNELFDQQTTFTSLRDLYPYLDVVSNTPSLAWTRTNEKLVSAAIFKNRISVNETGITNTEDIVWVWHSGLNGAPEGAVSFNDGNTVTNGKILSDVPPKPLLNNTIYVYAIWAWEDKGNWISASSPEHFFLVE